MSSFLGQRAVVRRRAETVANINGSGRLRYAEPPEGIRHYRFPVSTWKHFERSRSPGLPAAACWIIHWRRVECAVPQSF